MCVLRLFSNTHRTTGSTGNRACVCEIIAMVRTTPTRILLAGALMMLLWLSAQSAAAQVNMQRTVSPLPASDYSTHSACGLPAPGRAGCLALELVPETPAARAHARPLGMTRSAPVKAGKAVEVCSPPTPAEGCYGLRPQDLHGAYELPTTAPSAQTIALVDAYDDPSIEEARHRPRTHGRSPS